MKVVCALLLLFGGTAVAAGGLSPNVRISSDMLGYDIQYRVYTPQDVEAAENLAVLFITDGPAY
ncbi:MAG: hypothetical protein OES93_14215, partial [Gammaproteobacteria bacterium]|nr:hypothetical protein [Gammaproteobacteria bacterium]